MNKKIIFAIVVALVLLIFGYGYISNRGKTRAIAGLESPVQEELKKKDPTGTTMEIDKWNVDITYKYKYEADALVLHTKNYAGYDLEGKLSPKDLGLGWGRVAEFNELLDFHWSQSGRWLNWELDSYDELSMIGSVDVVTACTSNNHIVPADKNVRKQLKKIKKGDHVKLTGYLVDINASKDDGSTFYWYSSTSREDTGDGACEVFYVTNIQMLQ